jgi:hypothetical protein
MARFLTLTLLISVILTGCQTTQIEASRPGETTQIEASRPGACVIPDSLTRQTVVPVGVLYPSGGFEDQSYQSPEELVGAGLNAVSLGWSILYNAQGDIVFDWDGSADDDAKNRWISRLQCAVVEAKEAGLIVSVWGQFQEAGVNGEPGLIREDIRERVLDASLDLIPVMARAAEEVQAEYYSPIAELDKFGGIEGHNAYFPRYVEAARPEFTGILYSQPNVLQGDPSFYSEKLPPALEGIDALGISWISYDCRPEDVQRGDWIIEQAAAQSVARVYISEIGGVRNAPESQESCMRQLIERWGGDSSGVFFLDTPRMLEDNVSVKGGWQEALLQSYLD